MLCMGKTNADWIYWAFFYFISPSWKLVMNSRIECREEVTCCSGAWLVIQLRGGAEQTVELSPPMVGRSWFSKCVFPWIQVSRSDLFSHILQLNYGCFLINEMNRKWAIARSLNCTLWNYDLCVFSRNQVSSSCTFSLNLTKLFGTNHRNIGLNCYIEFMWMNWFLISSCRVFRLNCLMDLYYIYFYFNIKAHIRLYQHI